MSTSRFYIHGNFSYKQTHFLFSYTNLSSSYFIFLFYVNITQINCLIFISAVGLAESQDAAWQPGLQLPIGSFKSNPDEPGKIHYEQMQLDSFVSLFVQPC